MKRKKIFAAVVICTMLISAFCTGCTKPESAENPGGDNNPAEDIENKNAQAEQAYMDFLEGNLKVTTAESFREDDDEYNFDGLTYGEYSYDELKAAIDEFEGYASIAKYSFLDFGGDGINQMVLRFKSPSPDSGFMNWTGILHYNGENLELNYQYQDGYRTFADLYTTGYLETGGAIGAGAHTVSLAGFDDRGVGSTLFTVQEFYGIAACDIRYDLSTSDNNLTDAYDDIAGDSEFFVREYIKDGEPIKICASQWSDKSAVKAREEELIEELVSLGAEQISEEEMNRLSSTKDYEGDLVNWKKWDSSAPDEEVWADYADYEILERPEAYTEFIADESEYQTKVIFFAQEKVTDVCILSLNFEEITDENEIRYSGEKLYSQKALTAEKPLVVGMTFIGDTPNMGISYVDSKGEKQTYAINMSGFDSSLFLEKAIIDFN